MAGSTTNVSIRMDKEVKAKAEALFSEMGISLSAAINMFLRQAVREEAIPFRVTLRTPNKETIAAMEEAKRIAKDPTVKGYRDVDKFFE